MFEFMYSYLSKVFIFNKNQKSIILQIFIIMNTY